MMGEKRRMLAVLLAILLLASMISPATAYTELTSEGVGYKAPAPEAVITLPDTIANIFPDPALARTVAERLGVSVETIVTQGDLNRIWSLHARPTREIQSLQGMQYLHNLTWLDLSRNRISDLRPLAGLTNLETLILVLNSITDISPLAELTNLQRLYLSSQSFTREPIPWASTLVFSNILRDINGTSFPPSLILNDGMYNNGQLMWVDLPYVCVDLRHTLSISYGWDQIVHIGNATATFAGRTMIPLLPFHDVNSDDWFSMYAWIVVHNQWMRGTSATTFEPHEPLTRAMVATILHRFAGEPYISF